MKRISWFSLYNDDNDCC